MTTTICRAIEHPTAADLDDPELPNPIIIAHASGHMGTANTRMLEKLGITKDTPDPEGGVYGRLADGTPNGYMEENAFIHVAVAMPVPTEEEIAATYAEAQKVYASHGIATVQDGMTSAENAVRLGAVRSVGGMLIWTSWAMRISALPPAPSRMTPIPIMDITAPAATKLFLDGSPQGRTAWMSEPYLGGEPGHCGYPIYQDDQVCELIRVAISREKQLLTRSGGDAASEQLLRCYTKVKEELGSTAELLSGDGALPDRAPRSAGPHGASGHDRQLLCSAYLLLGRCAYPQLRRAPGNKMISPMRAAIDRGVVYTMHQDTPVVPPDMLLTIWAAVNRMLQEWHRDGSRSAHQCLGGTARRDHQRCLSVLRGEGKGQHRAGQTGRSGNPGPEPAGSTGNGTEEYQGAGNHQGRSGGLPGRIRFQSTGKKRRAVSSPLF